ncbi:hypothetical protein BSIN_5135 [Burkholderia singularis]|uniref:Uncharacterized protein n=1 Tax=Burkholderia singularis TaxID=1503053 RepID=A0A238HBX8_9BURK|nr:hypothetical protein BSIN_5135 [Burkholderia singularis]
MTSRRQLLYIVLPAMCRIDFHDACDAGSPQNPNAGSRA